MLTEAFLHYHPFSAHASPYSGPRGPAGAIAGARPSCHRSGEGVNPGQVAKTSQSHTHS